VLRCVHTGSSRYGFMSFPMISKRPSLSHRPPRPPRCWRWCARTARVDPSIQPSGLLRNASSGVAKSLPTMMSRRPCVPSSGRRPSLLPLPGAHHRSRSWGQHTHHRAHDLGHSAPSRSSGAVARSVPVNAVPGTIPAPLAPRVRHACPEPRGPCPHAAATENSPLTNRANPCHPLKFLTCRQQGPCATACNAGYFLG